MASEMTDWFPASTPPSREGAYEVNTPRCSGNKFSMWDGAAWLVCGATAKNAAYQNTPSIDMRAHDATWRGFNTKQKG